MGPTMLIVCLNLTTCTTVQKEFPSVEACEKFATQWGATIHECRPIETLTKDEVMRFFITGSIK